jgi:hypothetical protein
VPDPEPVVHEGVDRLEHLARDLAAAAARVRTPSFSKMCLTCTFTVTGLMNTALQMQQAGVTSVICLCEYQYLGWLWDASTSQGYFPEWLNSTFGNTDNDFSFKVLGNRPQQAENAFGVTFAPRQVPITDEPYWWGVREAAPSVPEPPYTILWMEKHWYRSLLLLASGIQMAGPEASMRSVLLPAVQEPAVA